jgi:probable rRNA maturation factor
MKRSAAAGLKVDVLVQSDHWQNAGAAKAVVRRALEQAAATLSTKVAELTIVLTDDDAMRTLNRNWRGVDAATNVLAFPARNFAPSSAARRPVDRAGRKGRAADYLVHQIDNHVNHLGDVVLAYETVNREARRDGKPFDHHLSHLVVHGFLHLLGYDHMNDAQARRMETTERDILRDLAVPDPYGTARAAGRRPHRRAAKRPREARARRADNA